MVDGLKSMAEVIYSEENRQFKNCYSCQYDIVGDINNIPPEKEKQPLNVLKDMGDNF